MALVTVITGAGSGVGRATAQAFLGAGHRVALLGRRQDALEDTANGHANALVCPCDVTDPDRVTAVFDGIVATPGGLMFCSTMPGRMWRVRPSMRPVSRNGCM